jgi:hypothetical protein
MTTTCRRCGQERYPGKKTADYVCQRCQAVLAGQKNVRDPRGVKA